MDGEEERRNETSALLLPGERGPDVPRPTASPNREHGAALPPRARPASARRGTTWGTKLSAAARTELNLERPSELRSPRFGSRTRYRTQEVAGSSPLLLPGERGPDVPRPTASPNREHGAALPPRARPASARRGTTWGTKLSAAARTELNLERPSELRSPRFGSRTRYRTQEVAGSSPASSIPTFAAARGIHSGLSPPAITSVRWVAELQRPDGIGSPFENGSMIRPS